MTKTAAILTLFLIACVAPDPAARPVSQEVGLSGVPTGDRIELPPDPQVDLTLGWSTSTAALSSLEWTDLGYQLANWREFTEGSVGIMFRVCNAVRSGKRTTVTDQELYVIRRRMFWWRPAYPRSAESVERCFNRNADLSINLTAAGDAQ